MKESSDKTLITEKDEPLLETGLCVNLDLRRVIVTKDNVTPGYPFYISLGVSTRAFLQLICQRLEVPSDKCEFSYWDKQQYELPSTAVQALEELGVTECCTVNVSIKTENRHQYQDSVYEEHKIDWLEHNASDEQHYGNRLELSIPN